MGLSTYGWDVSGVVLRIFDQVRGQMEGFLETYSKIDDVSLVIESVFADPETRSFDYSQDAGFLAGSGTTFELAEAAWVLLGWDHL